MKEIKLTQGYVTLVDDEDYEYLNQFNWIAHYEPRPNSFYATRNVPRKQKGEPTRMARLIMNTPKGMVTDHINGDTLDNRKTNLRNCTVAENNRNKVIHKKNTTGYKGVFPCYTGGRYFARVHCNGKSTYLGTFETPELGAIAYNKMALIIHGEFARLNVIKGHNE